MMRKTGLRYHNFFWSPVPQCLFLEYYLRAPGQLGWAGLPLFMSLRTPLVVVDPKGLAMCGWMAPGQLYILGPESLNLGSLQREDKTASSSTRDTKGTGYLSKLYMVLNHPRKSRRPGGWKLCLHFLWSSFIIPHIKRPTLLFHN